MPNNQLSPNTLLQGGKYRIIRTLGQGGFGITYEAEQTLIERRVCIKEFYVKQFCNREDGTSQVTLGSSSTAEMVSQYMAKFIKEAKTIAKLKHPGIIQIYDVFTENNTAYYVMEFIKGQSLNEVINESGPIPQEKAIKYIRQVGEALAYAHSQYVMHLDVKPSNIMLDGERPILIDFGLSKQYYDTGEQTSSTPIGISPGYAPLEQYQEGGVKEFSPSTDVYSLAATLYKLLTGLTPPHASTIVEKGIPAIDGVDEWVYSLINKSMQPRRQERPQGVKDFLSFLNSDESTEVHHRLKTRPTLKPQDETYIHLNTDKPKKSKMWLWVSFAGIVVVCVALSYALRDTRKIEIPPIDKQDTSIVSANTTSESTREPQSEQISLGCVRIASSPSGARIWLDGKYTQKKTPASFDDLAFGKHIIKLVLEGYEDYYGNITISSDKEEVISIALVAKEKPIEILPELIQVLAHDQVELSERFNVVFVIRGESEPTDFHWEPGDNFTLLWGPGRGSSKSPSSITTEFQYILQAKDIGTFTLPQATAKTNNTTIRSRSVSIKVVEDSSSNTQAVNQNSDSETSKTPPSADIVNNRGFENGHEWVDLGLSVKWASCNLGAPSSSERGNYYSWGELFTKKDNEYISSSYLFRIKGEKSRETDNDTSVFSKYNTKRDHGVIDNKTRLDLSDDVARLLWGGGWRIPTKMEFEELINNCTFIWTSINGKNGYKVTSKKNGNSIFLPAGDYHDDGNRFMRYSDGYYWSSSLYTTSPNCAWALFFNTSKHIITFEYRFYGFSIRPVT